MFPDGGWSTKIILAAFSEMYKVVIKIKTFQSMFSQYPREGGYEKVMTISAHPDEHYNLLIMHPKEE